MNLRSTKGQDTQSQSGMRLVKLTQDLAACDDPQNPTSAQGNPYYVSGTAQGNPKLSPNPLKTVKVVNYLNVQAENGDVLLTEEDALGTLIMIAVAST